MRKILTLLFVLFVLKGFTQDTIRISEIELYGKALNKNLQMQLARREVDLAKAQLLASRALYLPNITTSYSVMNTNSPLNAFGFKLNQSRIQMTDFNPDLLNSPNSISNFSAKIELQQPIINLDGVYQKKAGIVKADVLKIKQQRTEEYLQFELRNSYLMLQLAYKIYYAVANAHKTTLANLSVIENYYSNGLVQKSDVLNMKVRLNETENQIRMAKTNILNASDYLLLLLNEEDSKIVLLPVDELNFEPVLIDKDPLPDPNGKDLLAYQKSLEAYQWMIKSSKAKFLPRLNAFGSFEFNDYHMRTFGGNGYLVGLQLSWNLFDGLKSKGEQSAFKADLHRAEIEIQQYQQQSTLELKKVVRQLNDAEQKVQSQKEAWEQSRESYRIRKNRYDQGLEKSSDLLSAETLMTQIELAYYQSVYEYKTSLSRYQFLKK